jgi:NADH:ubiquinone oxidoreductase subunit F (NADH-binding)
MSSGLDRGLPRLLAGLHAHSPMSLAEHMDRFGPLPPAPSAEAREAGLAAVAASGLLGRGGAGFPAATKLRAVAGRRGPRVVVANGAEGEPASRKDERLMAGAPHLVLDGAALAARLVDAEEVLLAVKRTAVEALEALFGALEERAEARLAEARVSLVEASDRYVAGEESALVDHLNGGPGKPTFIPPRPFESGVGRRPTLIQNVETLAHMALIARFGPAWFRELGTLEDPGSLLITVGGSVANPGVYEIAAGTPLGTVIRAAGGPTAPIQAALLGGYGGSWFAIDSALDLEIGHAAMRRRGATLGPGIVFLLPEDACGVLETARVAGYLADESSGQCGPCVHGLAAIADTLDAIASGSAPQGTHEWLTRWSEDVVGRGACHHPDGAGRFVTSCVEVFADDIDRHERARPCHPRPTLAAMLPLGESGPEPALARR